MADLREQKLHHEISRADRARALLEDDLLKSSLEQIDRELLEALMQTSAEDEKRREKIHLMMVYGRKWRELLWRTMETGKLAAVELEEKRKPKLWGFK